MVGVELYQLRYFESVARHQSMAKASEELHVSQPALSKAIKKLEGDLGVELFDRVGKRIFLNERGLCFRDSANRLLAYADQSVKSLRALDVVREGTVNVVVRGPQREAIMCTSAFMQAHPGICVSLDVQDTFDKSNTVWEADVVFCQIGQPFDPSVGVPYAQCGLGLLVPSEHWLPAGEKVDLKALKDESFVLLTRPYRFYEEAYRICLDEGGFTPNVRCMTGSHLALAKFVSDGLGIGFVDGCDRMIGARGVRFVPLDHGAPRESLCFACRRPYRLSAAAAAYVDFVFDYFGIPKDQMERAIYDWA